LRHSATQALLTRRDVIVVASVSCIYGLGTPQEYVDRALKIKLGESRDREDLLRILVTEQYTRNDLSFTRGTFRVRGDTIEVFPVYEELAVRIEMFGDEVERLYYLHPLTGEVVREVEELFVFPATHYVAGPDRMERAIRGIEAELEQRLAELEKQGKLLEAQRLRMRTTYDIEMMRQVGFCSGIENYSRHIDGRAPGSAGACLIDYFPDDFLLVIDESHVTVPQIGGMYEGDMSRKRTLVEHGFRLPSAMDNRPLKWEEFTDRIKQTVYLSATPGNYELGRTQGEFVEQVIRPTGLVDPEVVIKPTKGQIDDLVHEIRLRTEKDERVLVTTLTKKMAEDLTDYLLELGIQVRYLHSEVDTLRRVELLRELPPWASTTCSSASTCSGRASTCPRCRWSPSSTPTRRASSGRGTSLIQTIGRAARNVSGQVHMYADTITPSMRTRSRRPTGAARSRSPTTPAPGSTRSRCASASPISPTGWPARPKTPTPCSTPASVGPVGPRSRGSRRCPAAAARPWGRRRRRARMPGTTSTPRRWPVPSSPTLSSRSPSRCSSPPATSSSRWPLASATRSRT
jgi:excinuclease ABC subunit B